MVVGVLRVPRRERVAGELGDQDDEQRDQEGRVLDPEERDRQPAGLDQHVYTRYRSATRRLAGSCLATRNHISTSDTRMMT